MQRTVKSSPLAAQPSMGRNDLLLASKAIHDALAHRVKSFEDSVPGLVRDAVADEMAGVEMALAGNITKAIERDFESRLTVRLTKVLAQEVSDAAKGMEERLAKTLASFESLAKEMERRLGAAEAKALEVQARYDKALNVLALTQEQANKHLVDAIKALPTPNVNVAPSAAVVSVPENAIRIEQAIPIVNLPEGAIRIEQASPIVNVPEGAIHVQVEQRPSIVNMSVPKDAVQVHVKSEAPVVNVPKGAISVNVKQQPSVVHVPENAIQVKVEQRKTKSITDKTIVYDQATGRPAKIIEETTEE